MNSKSILLTIINLAFMLIVTAQENNTGTILIYSKPDNVKISISELDYKMKKVSSDPLKIENVPEGNYNFKFRYQGYKMESKFFLPANDTLTVLGNFVVRGITAVTSTEFRDLLTQNIQKQRFKSEIHKDVIILNGPGIPLELIAEVAWQEGQNRKRGEEDSVNLLPSYNNTDIVTDTLNIEDEFVDDQVFYIVEDMPRFNGGDPAIEFRKFIALNLRYPHEAAKKNIKGRVIVQFAIDSRGRLVDAKVVAGVHPLLDQEAIRVVELSPLWTPGKQRGKAVKVLFTFPVRFSLQ